MQPVGQYLLVKDDAWSSSRIVFPIQETLQLQLLRRTRQREHCSGEELKQKLLLLVAQALVFYKQQLVPVLYIVGTCVDDRLVLVCTGGVPGVPEQVHEVAGAGDDVNASLYLRRAVDVCMTSMETFTIPVFACCTTESLTGVPCWTLPFAAGLGTLVKSLSTLAVYARPGTLPQPYLPLLDDSGCVFSFAAVQLSPLFSQLYVKLYDHALVTDVYPVHCSALATEELQRVLNGLSQTQNSWTCNFISLSEWDTTVFNPTGVPEPQPLALSDSRSDGAGVVSAETIHASSDLSTLAQILTPALVSYASTASLEEWRQQYDTLPLVLSDMRQQRHRLVVRAYIEVKDEELHEASPTAVAEHKLTMLHALAHEATALTYMDGLVFDWLLMDVQPANVPARFHPSHFLSDPRGDGFTTIMLLMCWRQTLARFIAVGMETLESDALKQSMVNFRHFRVGLIVQAPHLSVLKSTFRMVQGQPCFFINATETAMRGKPTLQQQKAESRNFFVGYFITQALVQLVPLLCQQGEDACQVCASLFGSYHGQMKPNSENNLTKLYEKLQGTARTIRQKLTRTGEPAGGGGGGRRR